MLGLDPPPPQVAASAKPNFLISYVSKRRLVATDADFSRWNRGKQRITPRVTLTYKVKLGFHRSCVNSQLVKRVNCTPAVLEEPIWWSISVHFPLRLHIFISRIFKSSEFCFFKPTRVPGEIRLQGDALTNSADPFVRSDACPRRLKSSGEAASVFPATFIIIII